MTELSLQSTPKVALLGSYTPRRCGIATFTEHLRTALAKASGTEPLVIAINDPGQTYNYGPEVMYEITQNCRESYVEAAERINASNIDMVSVQHEFGIFGGPYGEYLLDFLDALKKPFTVTLHTILTEPTDGQRRIMARLAKDASSLVVMSHRGASILKETYQVPSRKIKMIHHGVPDRTSRPVKPAGSASVKTLMTFGLLSPDKGIENVIKAMPRIIAECPETRYVVVGATHPHVKAHSGESYRESLINLAAELEVCDHVHFLNRFVSQSELEVLLRNCDIYVTPYLKLQQITSGTLSYAVGTGKAVISTPYWHAEELLADGRGILVPCRDPGAIATAATALLTNDAYRNELEERAFAMGDQMTWAAVSQEYWKVIREGVFGQSEIRLVPAMQKRSNVVRPVVLDHLQVMTDGFGMFQHAIGPIPRYSEGYCVDDNCRGLLLMGMLEETEQGNPDLVRSLATKYLAFMAYAQHPETKEFRNMMASSRTWLEDIGSEDSRGRCLFTLGSFIAKTRQDDLAAVARELFENAAPLCGHWKNLRSSAYAILGFDAMVGSGNILMSEMEPAFRLRSQLSAQYDAVATADWNWFEPFLSYCNARIPQALLVSAQWTKDKRLTAQALSALEWLWNLQMHPAGFFEPIGSDRVFHQGTEKPRFDQQPVEVTATISACLTAAEITGDRKWNDRAWTAFQWFTGANHLGESVYNPESGGCYDGLHENGINLNMGAESTLSYLMSQEELRAASAKRARPATEFANAAAS